MSNERKKHVGLFKILVGTTHMVKGSDGVKRQFRVTDKNRGSVKDVSCVCLACNATYADEAELRAKHPEESVLRKQQEPHPFGWWSNQPKAKGDADPGKVVGLLSDEYLDL